MKKTTKIRLSMYFIAFVLPILGMMNCPDWNASGGYPDCFIDGSFFRLFADLCYMGIFISSFMAGIPILIYSIIILIIVEKICKLSYKLSGDEINAAKVEEKLKSKILKTIAFFVLFIFSCILFVVIGG